jgi:hypothetical protein
MLAAALTVFHLTSLSGYCYTDAGLLDSSYSDPESPNQAKQEARRSTLPYTTHSHL